MIGLDDSGASIGMAHQYQSLLSLPYLQNSLVVFGSSYLHLHFSELLYHFLSLQVSLPSFSVLNCTYTIPLGCEVHEVGGVHEGSASPTVAERYG